MRSWPRRTGAPGRASEQLTEYFRTLFQSSTPGAGERWSALFQRVVLDGKAAVAVHPRGELETKRALELLNQLQGVDLENQTLEHAATEKETPIFTRVGKVLTAAGAPHTAGPKSP